MKVSDVTKSIAALAAAVIFTSSICGSAPLDADAEATPVLQIEQVQVTEEELASSRTVEVDVIISDNGDGFLATSFGIQYDTALVFEEAVCVNAAGLAHTYACNPDTGLLWFSGAASSGSAAANAEFEEVMFTLTFTVPEDAAAGTSYPLSFCWTKANGRQGFWHLPSRTNVIGGLQSNSMGGSITIPDPNAPKLSNTSLRVTTGGEGSLSVLNHTGSVTWISDNTQVATVTDGVVTGVSAGTCNVHAIIGSALLTCAVTVTEEAYYDITETSIIYLRDPNKVVSLECPVPENSTVSWISDNTTVVTVDNGYLQGIQNGAATIYAICSDSIYTVQVIVEFPADTEGTGDVNLDGDVSVIDVVLLNHNILCGRELSVSQQHAADVNMNSSIDAADSLNILKHIIGLVDELPIVA